MTAFEFATLTTDDLVTGEAVALDLPPASLGSRIVSGLIDVFVTMILFIGTYFVALTLGRLLKHRAGVQLGVLFQLFCLTLAFYTAISFYGVEADWRRHVGAALFLLSIAFLIALLNRYLWDGYWERKRRATIPQFLRQVVALFIFVIAFTFVLIFVYHA